MEIKHIQPSRSLGHAIYCKTHAHQLMVAFIYLPPNSSVSKTTQKMDENYKLVKQKLGLEVQLN